MASVTQPEIAWTFKTGTTVYSSLCLGPDGTLYAGNGEGMVYAVRPPGSLEKHVSGLSAVSGSRGPDP